MKGTTVLVAVFLAAGSFMAGFGADHYGQSSRSLPANPIVDPSDPDIQTLVAGQKKFAAALAPFDSTWVVSHMAPDMRAVNAANEVLDRPMAIRAIREAQAQLLRVEDDSIQVRRYGPVAIMWLRETATFRSDTGEASGRLRMTEVWLRRSGSWTAVASQATVLP